MSHWLDSPNAHCSRYLTGDTRKECIGVYKVPMDDRIKAYVESPEQLKKFAPELKFVEAQKPPETSAKALEVLLAQRLAADDIKQVVLEGKLEEAGIKLLNLIPKVTLACRIVQAESMSEAQELFLERKVSLVLGLYGETDVMIGQGIRGELGASAPAQINIIKQLTESNEAFDELLAMVRSQLGK